MRQETQKALLDEYVKIAAHSVQEAQDALDQLQSLEDNRPTPGQIARYAALGAAVGPVVGMGRQMIQRGGVAKGLGRYFSENAVPAAHGLFSKPSGIAWPVTRHIMGDMAAGATTSGAVPIVRGAMDRSAARSSLKHYLASQEDPTA